MNHFNLEIPILYDGDGRFTLSIFKQIYNGEFLFFSFPKSDYLSAPFTYELADFPIPMFADWLIIKLFSLFNSNYIVGFNIFIIISFILNPISMYYVLRKFRVNIYLALSIALLYNMLPFHLMRFMHTFYIGYYLLPLLTYVLIVMLNRKPLFFKYSLIKKKFVFDFSKRNIFILIIVAFSSTLNFYYTFYFCLFVAVITLLGYFYQKNLYHFYSGLLVLSLSVIPFALNMIPYQVYKFENGVNKSIAQRGFQDSEILGLKITQLLLPVTDHKNEYLKNKKNDYNSKAPLINENDTSTLGFIGSIGFVVLIISLLYSYKKLTLIRRLATLNIIALLYSTVGGFSIFFALYVSPQIRGQNRISIFIATFSFIAIALVIHYLLKRYKSPNYFYILISSLLLIIGLYDQIPRNISFKTDVSLKNTFLSDQKFIEKLEESFGSDKNNMVMQFPYMPFPEHPSIVDMYGYSHLLGYLHSSNLKWSYGAVEGRDADDWLKRFNKESLAIQIDILKSTGFGGIYIDRLGYKDRGKSLEEELIKLLDIKPLISEDSTKSFFKFKPTGNTIYTFQNDTNGFFDRDRFSHFTKGFYGWEGGVPGNCGWTSGDVVLELENNQEVTKKYNLSFIVKTIKKRNISIKHNGKDLQSFNLSDNGSKSLELLLNLLPGVNKIEISTDTVPELPGNGDPRKLAFYISELNIYEQITKK